MKTTIATALAVALIATTAHAEVYNYACHGPDDFKLRAAKLDTAKKTIAWNGIVYRNMKQVSAQLCQGMSCFEATSRDGTVTLSTATQGVATLALDGAAADGDTADEFECNLVRR
jgi:hypothetical protein